MMPDMRKAGMKKKINHNADTDQMMVDKEFIKFESDRLEMMPTDILNKAIEILAKEINEETKQKIREDIKESPIYWFAPYHFGWGMSIRNLLRDKVCPDDKLPSGNWDDYYVQIIEIVVHKRYINIG